MRSNQTTTRMWIGGGDNQASNPHDWSDPNGLPGAPRPGDTLILNNGTINISDNDLKGDTLTLAGEGPTINLDNAHLRLQGGYRAAARRQLYAECQWRRLAQYD